MPVASCPGLTPAAAAKVAELKAEEGTIVKSPRSSLRRRNSSASSVGSLESPEALESSERATEVQWTEPGAPQKVGPFTEADFEASASVKPDARADSALAERFEQVRQANDPALALASRLAPSYPQWIRVHERLLMRKVAGSPRRRPR